MIYTVTFNPAIDYVMHVPAMCAGEPTVPNGRRYISAERG